MKNTAQHFSELDGLRGLLALWVAVSHVLCWTGISDIAWRFPVLLRESWSVFIYAQAAVDAFIILSGFVISYLVEKYHGSYRSFLLNRTFRIYPVYVVCLTLSLATAILVPKILADSAWSNSGYFPAIRSITESEQINPIAHFVLHLALLNGLVPKSILANTTATFLPPAWSIALEWQYYLVAPMIATMVVAPRGLAVLLIIAILGAQIASQWTNLHLAFLPSQLPLFLVGIATYHLFQLSIFQKGVSTRQAECSVILMCGIALLTQWHTTALIIWALVVGAMLVGNDTTLRTPLGSLRQILRSPLLQMLGSISYPLYLVHWPIIIVILYCVLHFHPNVTSFGAALFLLVVGLPLMLSISYVLNKVIEVPGIEAGRKLIGRLRAQAATTSA